MKKVLRYFFVLIWFTTSYSSAEQTFKLGVELLSVSRIREIMPNSHTVALITNQTGITQKGEKTKDVLSALGIKVGVILTPEHGIQGTIAAEKGVDLSYDEQNIPLISLYNAHIYEKQIAVALKQIDMIIFDIQDSGMRHYTYIATLLKALQLAARVHKPIMVLDRPNPLGIRMEGPLVASTTFSEIAAVPIPLRHSMTVGEIALYCNAYVLKKPVDLHVVTMQGYHRKRGLSDSLPIYLSPNIQTLQACFGYSFLGLLGEVQPFDVGVGTSVAFQRIGLPDDLCIPNTAWKNIARCLDKAHVRSQVVSYYNERKKKPYTGLLLSINDINTVPSFTILINLLKFFKQQGVPLSFSSAFDKAIGTKKIRKYIMGHVDKKTLACMINEQIAFFYQQAQTVFCYKPYPCVVLF